MSFYEFAIVYFTYIASRKTTCQSAPIQTCQVTEK